MRVTFRTNKLQRQFESRRDAQRAFGDALAKKYVQRIQLLQLSKNVHEAAALPGLNVHPLKGDREGQWSVKLTGFYRLIFTVVDDAYEFIRIEEVSKHYDH